MSVRRSPPRPQRRVVTTIREVQDPADPALAQAYRLLTSSFHRGERVLRREWIGSLRERRDGLLTDIAWHLIVAERKGRVVGFTSGTYLGNVNLGVIGYLAIATDERAGGSARACAAVCAPHSPRTLRGSRGGRSTASWAR